MSSRLRARNVLMILAGVAGLLMNGWFAPAIGDFAHSYLGNLSVSFAVYFLVSIAAGAKLNRLVIGLIAFVVVGSFELADGFGFMENVYDPFDYLADALGVALAYLVDVLTAPLVPDDSDRP